MFNLGCAPASNDPPDRPEIDLACAIENIGDILADCAAAAARMTAHEAEYCGADPILAKLREVVEELRNVTGG